MNEEFWQDRWQADRIGFHQEDVNRALIEHAPEMPWPSGGRIFVPLCGKSEDMIWLRDHGQSVVGVELASIACRSFFDEHDEEYELRDSGRFRFYVGDELAIFCGDFFKLDADRLGDIDGVYDRAALVALPESMRSAYVEHIATLVPEGIAVLMQTLEYDHSDLAEPPFSISEAEVRELYEPFFEVELIESGDFGEPPEKFADRGMTRFRESSWQLIRGAA